MEFTLIPVGGWFLVAFIALLLVALLFVGPVGGQATVRRKRILTLFRFTAIGMLVLAMLRPTIVTTETTQQPSTMILLVDDSRSMQVDDVLGAKSRWDAARTALQEVHPLLRELSKDVEIKLYRFAAQAESVDVAAPELKLGEQATGEQTAIGAVLEDMLQREQGKRLVGVVLLSDGAQRAIPPLDVAPQVTARRLAEMGYKLYAVPFGKSRGLGQVQDLAIEEFLVPRTVFVKNQLDVNASVRADGYVNQDIVVSLYYEGQTEPVASRNLQVRQDGQRLPVEFEYVPELPGEYKVTLKATPPPGELVTTNNERSTFVTVLKGGLKVLYVEGTPRVEQKFLRRALDASPDINVDYLRIDAQKPETRPADLAERFRPGKYDVYILGDVDSTAFTEEELKQLRATVDRGAGLIMLGGFHSFGAGGYGQTPLAEVLPITFNRFERQRFNEPIVESLHLPPSANPRMVPTAAGQSQSLMMLASRDKNAAAWAELPPLKGGNRFEGLKPGSLVLAESPAKNPLLVAKDYGAGRVLAFAGDSTWQWAMQGHAAPHKRFWRQVVLWLARKDMATDGQVWIALDERRFAPSARVEFTFGANSPQGEPLTDVQYSAEITLPNGNKAPVRVHRAGDHMAGLFLEARDAGDYTIRVEAKRGDQSVGQAKARFLVYQQDLELDNTAADHDTLKTLAEMTEGRLVMREQLSSLLEQLREDSHAWDIQKPIKLTLWDTWPFMLGFVSLLSTEWFLRRRWGLA